MAISLEKGQRIQIGLQKVCVGLGWDPNNGSSFDFDRDQTTALKGPSSPNNRSGFDFDLDASAFMLGFNHKLPHDDFFVFYNNAKSPDGAVETTGDDLTGGSSDGGDDETIKVDLSLVDKRVEEILFTATIYKAEERRQNFGQVHNSYIRIYNELTGEEIARYDLDEDFSVETAVEFGRLYRYNGEWKFEAIGNGNKGGLQALVNKYA